MITSSHNPRLQWVRLLQSQAQARREAQAFIAEGVRLSEEALEAGWEAQLVLYTEEISPRGQLVVDAYTHLGALVEQVTPQAFKSAADSETPQGLLLVLSMRLLPRPEKADFFLILDGVRDPGNLGTILRSARAAGVQTVLLPPGTVDPFSPKVVRAGMGAHFRLPVLRAGWDELNQELLPQVEAGMRIYLADSGDGQVYTQAEFRAPLALIVGGEAQGAGVEALHLAHEKVHIPMPGGSESLNAAVATGILLFEVLRQRQNKD